MTATQDTTMISSLRISEDADEQSAQLLGVAPGADIGLVLDTDHPTSRYGQGKLLQLGSRAMVDGTTFRLMRDTLGAYIVTTHPRRVAEALGVPHDEHGIETGPADSMFPYSEG